MSRKTSIEVINSLLLFLFLYTAIARAIQIDAFKNYLSSFALVGDKAAIVALAVPVTGGLVSMLLFFPGTRLPGMYGAAALLTLSVLYLASIAFMSPYRSCPCGGLLKQLSATQHFVLNILALLLALTGIVLLHRQKRRLRESEWPPVIFT